MFILTVTTAFSSLNRDITHGSCGPSDSNPVRTWGL